VTLFVRQNKSGKLGTYKRHPATNPKKPDKQPQNKPILLNQTHCLKSALQISKSHLKPFFASTNKRRRSKQLICKRQFSIVVGKVGFEKKTVSAGR